MKAVASQRAKREAVQPSLWDRLVNDLPGLNSELGGLTGWLVDQLGAERLEALRTSSVKALDADASLTTEQKRQLRRLQTQERQRDALEARGVVVSPDVLREAVRRDVEALFNTERFESVPLLAERERDAEDAWPPQLDDFPQARRSVVNFGVPPFAGRTSRDFDRDALAKEIKAVLAAFEPRLKESATKVTVTAGDRTTGLQIEVDGLLVMSPSPERMKLRTRIDLDSGLARTELQEG